MLILKKKPNSELKTMIHVCEFFADHFPLLVPSLLSSNNTGKDKMTQLTTKTDVVTSSETLFNISANITMPFKILNIFSYTHSLNVKVISFLFHFFIFVQSPFAMDMMEKIDCNLRDFD